MKKDKKLKLGKTTVANFLTTMEKDQKANILGGVATHTYGGQYSCYCTGFIWCWTIERCGETV